MSFEFSVWIVDLRLTKPDEEQSCSKLLLLYFNKSTQNKDLQLSCLENLQPTYWLFKHANDDEDEAMMASKRVFDVEEGLVDFRKKRVTDMEGCSRMILPKPLPTKHEA